MSSLLIRTPKCLLTFLHTLDVLQSRPILVACGDFSQQHPLANIKGHCHEVPNITSVKVMSLHQQFHALYNSLPDLKQIRYWPQTQQQIQLLITEKVLIRAPVTSDAVVSVFRQHPDALFLTSFKKGAHFVNTSILDSFAHLPVLSHIETTKGLHVVPVFKDMPLMLLESRVKRLGFINGQLCKAL